MNDVVAKRPAEPPVLELRAISKNFGALQVLSDISLTVVRGETVCIVGPSGSVNQLCCAASTGSKSPTQAPFF
jgi:ABC-type transporter Mla maintaining outer membrane lipid asymmetry ATPase subunit MlaF